MANKQLLEYIRAQLAIGADFTAIRDVLLGEGWTQKDVDEALAVCYKDSHRKSSSSKKSVAVIILVVVVLILLLSLVLLVYQSRPEQPSTPNNTVVPPVDNHLTGWAVCANMEDTIAKNECYQRINTEDELFDCDTIRDSRERSSCYLAKEIVVLKKYS